MSTPNPVDIQQKPTDQPPVDKPQDTPDSTVLNPADFGGDRFDAKGNLVKVGSYVFVFPSELLFVNF